ncbi:MAG: response regulator transcription factor [Clostridia bacterium]|nr:response regulator transcription factor [Clostridia bacterium]
MSYIYVVEDDENIREIETFALRNSGYTVLEFDCAKEFFKKLAERIPELVILDIMLPDEDGLDVLKKLRKSQETKKLPIMLVTAKASELDKVRGLDMGADDYISKPFGIMEFISRVKAIMRRSGSEKEKFLQLGEIYMDNGSHTVYVNNDLCELTFKEYNLLALLLGNAGIVMSRGEILSCVWGTNFEGESRTLDMHIKTLRKKLGDSGKRIKTVHNVGYMIE